MATTNRVFCVNCLAHFVAESGEDMCRGRGYLMFLRNPKLKRPGIVTVTLPAKQVRYTRCHGEWYEPKEQV